MDISEVKKLIGYKAVDTLVTDGMKLGMGTGSTAVHAIKRVREKMDSGEIKSIFIVPTSLQTETECRKYGVPLYTLNDPVIDGSLDLTIDGADEVNSNWQLIKGGGGALLLEKIVAYYSARYAIVVDDTKLVENLGMSFKVPVEVYPNALNPVMKKIESLGAEVTLRQAAKIAGPVITLQGNMILDVAFKSPFDAATMEPCLKGLPGVADNGLFNVPVTDLFIGRLDGTVEHRTK